jgi:glycosyltransferase involved in cell wall biosynthesis
MCSARRIPPVRRIIEVASGLRSIATLGERLELQLANLTTRVDALSSKLEDGDRLADDLADAKLQSDYYAAYERSDPLVTVCIATYNRAELVTTRAIPSILAQDYQNLEVLVVGDACTDDTAERVARIGDSRVSFRNLPKRGNYPDNPDWRWMVAGSAAMNEGLRLAKGDFVTHLDDDDEHLPDRVSKLLAKIKSTRADLVWHPFMAERASGWELIEAPHFQRKAVSTGSIFYHRWFARIHWDLTAYRLQETGDWNRMRRFKYIGAVVEREPAVLLRHFRERSQAKS